MLFKDVSPDDMFTPTGRTMVKIMQQVGESTLPADAQEYMLKFGLIAFLSGCLAQIEEVLEHCTSLSEIDKEEAAAVIMVIEMQAKAMNLELVRAYDDEEEASTDAY